MKLAETPEVEPFKGVGVIGGEESIWRKHTFQRKGKEKKRGNGCEMQERVLIFMKKELKEGGGRKGKVEFTPEIDDKPSNSENKSKQKENESKEEILMKKY